ncbi:phosphopantetheine-binding protein [Myxococcus sp. K15C18031901]|uniref:phosphopantetheine-binding protein n=1 Tax=Myxococcus dinghuensis TaxID=2906761 RepID=UPI0020A70A52|nr:phosphopantetheine-binding protein [Myxococcus dinghuensis]MCP3097322.1 phosphopantetheine-binding protein [Myxococcus dinghuensis]
MHHTEQALAAAMQEVEGGSIGYLPVSPLELLRERVLSAVEHVPFYRELYAPFGPVPSGAGFLAWFERLPVVSKSQLQAAGEHRILSSRYKASELIRRPTSGSTGVPFSLLLDGRVFAFRKWRFQRPHHHLVSNEPEKLTYLFPWDFVVRTPQEERKLASTSAQGEASSPGAGVRTEVREPKDHTQRFTALPKRAKRQGSDSPPMETKTQGAQKAYTVNSLLPPPELYEALEELAPESLVGFASVVAALARWMGKEGLRLPSIRQVWTTSEVLPLDGAEAIRQVLDCEPLKIYASNEFGFMAWQAEKDAPLHAESDRLHLEFLRREGTGAARPGELSRLVVTDLLNDTMPLLRYDIGDVARPCAPVAVTTTLACATLDGLEGKEADLLQPPDGRSVTTFQVLGAIKDHLPHAQYRFIGLSPARYVMQYVPGVGFEPANVEPTTARLREILGEGVEVLTHRAEAIRREPSGKLRPVVNLDRVAVGVRRKLAEQLGVLHLLALDGGEVARRVVGAALARVLPAFKATGEPDESLELYADLAISSLQFVQLLATLEKELSREIDDEDLLDAELVTVGDLVRFVEGLTRA